MAHYLDAEDDCPSASHSLYLVDEIYLRSAARGAALFSFVLPAPGHFFERLKEIDKFALMERTEDPAFTGANKASAIRDKAVHCINDAFMLVPAGVDAIVFSKTSHVRNAGHGRKA
jgi:hypothetical protein